LYLEYYNLRERPFELTPDPRFLFYTDAHQEAYAQMLFGVKMRKGFVMLTGEAGTGKTTLIHAVLKELQPFVKCALIFHTLFSAKGLFQNICKEFGLSILNGSKTDYVLQLHEFLRSQHEFARAASRQMNALVILDEAHNLDSEILEEIRLLSNFELEHKKLLQIMLVGQPELVATINRRELRQLNQRIALRVSLRRFAPAETEAYIAHRLRIAGFNGKQNLFEPDAVRHIHECSEGIARRINVLCENALVMGYVRGASIITETVIAQVNSEDFFSEMESAFENPVQREPLWHTVRHTDRFFSDIETLVESPPRNALTGQGVPPTSDVTATLTSPFDEVPVEQANPFVIDVETAIMSPSNGRSTDQTVSPVSGEWVDNYEPDNGTLYDNGRIKKQMPIAIDASSDSSEPAQSTADEVFSSSELAGQWQSSPPPKTFIGRDLTTWLLYLVVVIDVVLAALIIAAWQG
jgi:general secretion pathway protein A